MRILLCVVAVVLLAGAPGRAAASAPPSTPPPTPPPVSVNEFLPEDRGLGECISAIPKPGCGSDARGGWRQGLVLLAILVGLALIVWRIVVASRRAREDQLPAT